MRCRAEEGNREGRKGRGKGDRGGTVYDLIGEGRDSEVVRDGSQRRVYNDTA